MRVVMVLAKFYPHGDGTEQSALTLSRALCQSGHAVRVITARRGGLAPRDEIDGIRIDRVPWIPDGRGLSRIGKYTFLAATAQRLAELTETTDVIHCHMAHFHLIPSVLVGWRYNRPVVVKIAAGDPGGEIARMSASSILVGEEIGFLVMRVLRNVDAIIAPSTRVRDELLNRGLEHIVTIPNGVDTERFRPATPDVQRTARRELGLPADGTIVGFMGRLHDQKAPEVLLEAWYHSRFAESGAVLCLAGTGPMESQLRQMASGSGAGQSSSVRFLGRVSADRFFQSLDAFVLPSRYEGMPNALLEAMASGLPAIGTTVAGSEDIIENGRSGILARPSAVEDLVSALNELASPDARTRFGEAARARITSQFTVEIMARRYASLYEDVAAQKQGRRPRALFRKCGPARSSRRG